MIFAFFESLKYVGHLLPISFLRVFLGYYYLNIAVTNYQGDFLNRPRLAQSISETLPTLQIPDWYRLFLENFVIPQWQIFAFIFLGIQFAIAISYLIGYVVRPVAILAILFTIQLLIFGGMASADLYKTFIAIHFVFAWVGAGRCLGFDYYFYKRRRGAWW